LSREQVETYEQQRIAAEKLKVLRQAQAIAEKQTELTNSNVQVEIAGNLGDADLARARKAAEQAVVTAQAEGRTRELIGQGQSKRIEVEGEAEAAVLRRKVAALGDPRLYAMAQVAQALSTSTQPLVPQRLFITGDGGDGKSTGDQNILGLLLRLLAAEKAGMEIGAASDTAPMTELGSE
jgi:hypothetical protein